MASFSASKNENKLIELKKSLINFDLASADRSDIDYFNRLPLSKNRTFRKLYRPVKKNIVSDSFIIPVNSNTSVTAYLFKKQIKSASDPDSIIIYIHAGGWTLGNMDITNAVCSNICNTTGAIVLGVDYRLAPDFKFPSPIEDCYKAFCWAAQGAKYWKADPTKIFIMGSSCGANIASAVCLLARDTKGPKPAGQILIDPLTDCRLRTSSFEKYKDNPVLNSKQLEKFIEIYQREPKDILDPMFSPLLSKDLSRLPDTLLISAEYDILNEDSKLFEQALLNADTNARLFERQEALHGSLSFPKSENYKSYMNLVTDFVRGIALQNLKIK